MGAGVDCMAVGARLLVRLFAAPAMRSSPQRDLIQSRIRGDRAAPTGRLCRVGIPGATARRRISVQAHGISVNGPQRPACADRAGLEAGSRHIPR